MTIFMFVDCLKKKLLFFIYADTNSCASLDLVDDVIDEKENP